MCCSSDFFSLHNICCWILLAFCRPFGRENIQSSTYSLLRAAGRSSTSQLYYSVIFQTHLLLFRVDKEAEINPRMHWVEVRQAPLERGCRSQSCCIHSDFPFHKTQLVCCFFSPAPSVTLIPFKLKNISSSLVVKKVQQDIPHLY